MAVGILFVRKTETDKAGKIDCLYSSFFFNYYFIFYFYYEDLISSPCQNTENVIFPFFAPYISLNLIVVFQSAELCGTFGMSSPSMTVNAKIKRKDLKWHAFNLGHNIEYLFFSPLCTSSESDWQSSLHGELLLFCWFSFSFFLIHSEQVPIPTMPTMLIAQPPSWKRIFRHFIEFQITLPRLYRVPR